MIAEQVLRDLYESRGLTVQETATALGAGYGTVHRYMNLYGIERRPQGCQEVRTRRLMGYFSNWKGQVPYILGLTWADGTVVLGKRVKWELQRGDRCLLERIKDELDLDSSLSDYDSEGTDGVVRRMSQLCLHSGRVADFLIEEYGILPGKSFMDLAFPSVPEGCLSDFIRGYFDGDGSITDSFRSTPCFTFYGGCSFITGLRDKIVSCLGLSYREVFHKHATVYRVSWGSKADVLLLGNFLYPEGNYLFLPRKRKIFEVWRNLNWLS